MEAINTNGRDMEGLDCIRKKATAWEAKSTASPGISSQNTKTSKNSFSRKGNSLVHESFPSGTTGKEPACQAGDVRDAGSIPRLGRSPGGGSGNPF